ncbi:MAG TPA: hypothetical protein VHF28_00545 [Nitrososphaera sp.]|nr:hypothetical protein [Nitrososphaera sp.]
MDETLLSAEIAEKMYVNNRGYLKNELESLGVEPKSKNQLNDKEELQNISDNIKQTMFRDYKMAYSEQGDVHKEEAKSTVTVG